MNKKSIHLLLIICLLGYPPDRARAGYSCLYNNCKQVSIDNVKQTNAGTYVAFCYRGVPYSAITLASSIYASDEQGGRHQVIATEGLELDSLLYLPDDGVVRFSLTFDRLSPNTDYFDIIENNLPNTLHVYGIHKEGEKRKFPIHTEGVNKAEFNPLYFKAGTAVIKGKIHGYSRSNMPGMVYIPYMSQQIALNERREQGLTNCFKVEKDGSFCAEMFMDQPDFSMLTWADVYAKDKLKAFFYVRPGDTLDVQIWNPGRWNQKISYSNEKGNDCYGHLMEIWQPLPSLEDYLDQETINTTDYQTEVCRMEQRIMDLLDYLCWKFHLTPWESHLLSTRYRLQLVSSFKSTSDYIQKREVARKALLPNSSLHDDRFLNGMEWSDSTLIILHAAFSPNGQIATRMGDAGLRDNLFDSRFRPSSIRNRCYFPKDALVRAFVDSICSKSNVPFTQLIFIDPERVTHNRIFLENLGMLDYCLEDNRDIRVVLVVNQGHDDTQLQKFNHQNTSRFESVVIPEEEFIHYCAALNISLFPSDLTLQQDGQILHSGLYSYEVDGFLSYLYRLLNNKL